MAAATTSRLARPAVLAGPRLHRDPVWLRRTLIGLALAFLALFLLLPLAADWSAASDTTRTIWEIVHHLIRLAETASDEDCARVLAALPHSEAAEARQLCYRLFTICDQNGWSQEAQAYNQLITNWQYYTDEAAKLPQADARPVQRELI